MTNEGIAGGFKEAIHVAGIVDAAEAELLIACGVRCLGFPLVLGYHKEDLGIDDAAGIVARFRDRATFFLITYLNRATDIAALCGKLSVRMVQLHADVEIAELEALRRDAPALRIIKSLVVRPNNEEALRQDVMRFTPHVDAFITDTFDPETGATGATGKTHDWQVSRRLVELSPKPVILAGGLNPSNVRGAIETVRPAGVDVHTGIELDDGRKGREATMRFIAEAEAGFAKIR